MATRPCGATFNAKNNPAIPLPSTKKSNSLTKFTAALSTNTHILHQNSLVCCLAGCLFFPRAFSFVNQHHKFSLWLFLLVKAEQPGRLPTQELLKFLRQLAREH